LRSAALRSSLEHRGGFDGIGFQPRARCAARYDREQDRGEDRHDREHANDLEQRKTGGKTVVSAAVVSAASS